MSSLPSQRPLSPHLQVYKPQITSMMSIMHRITGFALAVGSLFLVSWLWAAAYSADYYTMWQDAASHWLGTALLIGWTFAFFYHFANGIRHMFWDMGRGFDLANVTKSGVLVILFALAMTALSWMCILGETS